MDTANGLNQWDGEKSLGTWLRIGECDYLVNGGVCGSRKVTHVIFLNTPSDEVYIVGGCSNPAHWEKQGGFLTIPRSEFTEIVNDLLAEGVDFAGLPDALYAWECQQS